MKYQPDYLTKYEFVPRLIYDTYTETHYRDVPYVVYEPRYEVLYREEEEHRYRHEIEILERPDTQTIYLDEEETRFTTEYEVLYRTEEEIRYETVFDTNFRIEFETQYRTESETRFNTVQETEYRTVTTTATREVPVITYETAFRDEENIVYQTEYETRTRDVPVDRTVIAHQSNDSGDHRESDESEYVAVYVNDVDPGVNDHVGDELHGYGHNHGGHGSASGLLSTPHTRGHNQSGIGATAAYYTDTDSYDDHYDDVLYPNNGPYSKIVHHGINDPYDTAYLGLGDAYGSSGLHSHGSGRYHAQTGSYHNDHGSWDNSYGGYGHGHPNNPSVQPDNRPGGHGSGAQIEYEYYTSDSSADEVAYVVTEYVEEEYQVAKKVPVVETT